MALPNEPLDSPRSILSSSASARRSSISSSSSLAAPSTTSSLDHPLLPPSGCLCPPLRKVNEERPSSWCRSFPRVYARLFDILWDAGLDRRSRAGLFELKGEAGHGPVVLAVLLYERDISLWPDLQPRFVMQCRHYWRHTIPPIRFWVVKEEPGKPPSPPTDGTISTHVIHPSSASIASRKSVTFVDEKVKTVDNVSAREDVAVLVSARDSIPQPKDQHAKSLMPDSDGFDADLVRAIAQLDLYNGIFENNALGVADD